MSASFDDNAIKAMLQKLLDAKPLALQAAGVSLLTEAQKSIIESGPGWPGFKRPPKRAHQLLWLTATLLRSLAVGGADNIFQEDSDSVTVGTGTSYGKYQNLGVPSHNLPPRPFLFIDENRLQLATAAYLNQLELAWSK